MRDFLSSQLGSDDDNNNSNKVELIPKEDRQVTGNFEVTVVGTGQVLHSKKHAGQGRAESLQEKRMILEQIQQLLLEEEEE